MAYPTTTRHSASRSTIATYAMALCLLACVSGCILPAQPELPASLQWLVEHQAEFWFAETQSLDTVDCVAGEDLPDMLSGCWAMARPAGGQIPVPHWEIYEFDNQSMRFTHWIMEDPLGLGLFPVVILEHGSYETLRDAAEPLRVRLVVTERFVSNPDTGGLDAVQLPYGQDMWEYEMSVVLCGHSLYLQVDDDPPTWWRYRPMDCLD